MGCDSSGYGVDVKAASLLSSDDLLVGLELRDSGAAQPCKLSCRPRQPVIVVFGCIEEGVEETCE
jgi:hypothetical protein